jgi:hypothetical protein
MFQGLFKRLGDAKRWKKELESYPIKFHQFPAIVAVSGETAPLKKSFHAFYSASHAMFWGHFGRRL